MLDIKLLRNNFDEVAKALSTRNEDFDLSLFKDLDEKRRNLLSEVEALKAKQNTTSKLIPQYKKEGKDVAPIMAEMKEISDKVKTLNADLSKAEEDLNNYMLTIPNIPHPSVPGRNDR